VLPEFYAFIKASAFRDFYPGFSTFAYIPRVLGEQKSEFIDAVRTDDSTGTTYDNFSITPEGIRDEYWPILYIDPEPVAGSLLGVDQYAERERATNIERARDIGEISISKGVVLQQRVAIFNHGRILYCQAYLVLCNPCFP